MTLPRHISLSGMAAPPFADLEGTRSVRIPQYRSRGPHSRYKGGLKRVGALVWVYSPSNASALIGRDALLDPRRFFGGVSHQA